MLEWIAKYWLEVLFGGILSGLTFVIRHHLKLIRDTREQHNKDLMDKIDDRFTEQKNEIKAELNSFDKRLETQKADMQSQMNACYANLLSVVDKREDSLLNADRDIRDDIKSLKDSFISVKSGMLTIHSKAFKEECHRLLEPNHKITLIEYENMLAEHLTYNQLGGNHEGDSLFEMVEAKYKHNLIDGGQLNN